MHCERFLERLSDDGPESFDAESLDAEALHHLDACAPCRRIHASYLRGRDLLRSLPSIPVSVDFAARLEHRIDRLEAHRLARRGAIRRAGRLTGAGVTMALAYLTVAFALGRLDGLHRLRGGTEPAPGVPSVRVVRPFTSLATPEVPGLFAAHAYPGRAEEPAGLLPLPGIAQASGATPGSHVDSPPAYRRPTRPASPHPVLVATPSWTFAAPPASFHFVSARPRSLRPNLLRTAYTSPPASPPARVE